MSNKLISNNIGSNFLLSLETQGIKMGLQRTIELLSYCNNPQNHIKSVQIIGTNGKGSTAAALSSILEANNYRVGLYTSPHLITLHERIQINRKYINESYIQSFITKYNNIILQLHCTFFEVLTVMALQYFVEKQVDIAILETGLGGRYDSVTACNPILQLFTSISKDHMNILGSTIEKIAEEKATAIHTNIPCISTSQTKTVKNILNKFADKNDTSINYNIYNFNINPKQLNGTHQKENILLAMTAAKLFFNLNTKNILKGINNIFWPGRLQIINKNPTIIFDVAHNNDSIIALCNHIQSLPKKGKFHLLLSIQQTKEISESINSIKNVFDIIICTKINDKMYNANKLSMKFQPFKNLTSEFFSKNLINRIVNALSSNDLLVIAGSHYWGGHIEKTFKNSFVVNKFN